MMPVGFGKRLLVGTALLGACAGAVAQQKFSNRSPDDIDPALRLALVEAIAEADSFEDRFDAEVWLTDMSQRLGAKVPNVEERLQILRTVHRHATAADLDPELVLAVIDVESNFDRYAISSASALGLMQVMPFWVEEVGETDMNLLFDIEFNILLGCRILKYYLDMEDGELMQALARYNGSTGRRWYGDRVLDRLRLTWFRN
jgi:soluble lytic murein transglycosylase-like protein